jgi:hypothetical protein
MNGGRRRAWAAALGLLWVAVVLGAYYVFHKPFQPGQVMAVGGALLDVLGVALLLTVAGGQGRVLLPVEPPATDKGLMPLVQPLGSTVLAVQALAGLALISLAVLALGLAGLARGWLLLGLALAALAILRRQAVAWWRGFVGWLRGGLAALKRPWPAFLALFLALMLAMAFLNALAPATKWDALTYHLTGPKLYAEAGRVHGEIDNHYLGFPQLTEMLYLWLMAWRGAGAGAALIHWLFGALTLMLVGAYAGRFAGGLRVGLLAAAVLLTAETIWWEFGWPYVDLTTMAYIAAAFVLLDAWRAERRVLLLVEAGLMAGCALGAKYTAVGAVVGLGALALWSARGGRAQARALLSGGLRFGGAALAGFAPWLVKNALLYGNAVYPFFFDALRWDAFRQAWYTRPGTGLLYTAPLRLLLLPWDATVCSQEGAAGFASPLGAALPLCDPSGKGSLSATIGPLFLALIPLLAVGWGALRERERGFVGRALLFLAAPYAVWLWGVATSVLLEQARLLLPIFPVLAILAALAVEGVQRVVVGRVRVGVVIGGAVAFVLALSLLSGALYTVKLGALPVLAGARASRDFLLEHLGWHYAAIEAVNRLPDSAVVMFLWEPRAFYCRQGVVCWGDALLDRWYHAMRLDGGNIGTIAARWQASGVTHLLLWRDGMEALTAPGADPFEPGDAEAFAAFVEGYLAPVWEGEAGGERFYTLYRWR